MKKQSGFSLIEILVVLVIMGLLISVVAPTVLNSADAVSYTHLTLPTKA